MLYLLATIRNGKINVTAEENGIKNSNLSQLLRDLEEETGATLLNRKSDGIEPTQAGMELYNIAAEFEESLHKLDNLQRRARHAPEIKFYLPANLSVDLHDFKSDCFINYTKFDKNFDIAILGYEPEKNDNLYITKIINENNRLITTWWVTSRNDNEKAADLHKFLVDSLI